VRWAADKVTLWYSDGISGTAVASLSVARNLANEAGLVLAEEDRSEGVFGVVVRWERPET
jgi:hypothetical protein